MSVTFEGFSRKPVGPQLQKILGISNESEFADIKKTISRLALTLDINRQGRDQLDKLSGVEDQLKTLFPAVFDTTQKLGFARRLTLQYFRGVRKRTRKRMKQKMHREPSQLTISPFVGTNSNQKQLTFTRIPQRRTPSRSNDPRHSGPTNQNSPPKEPESRDTGISEPSCCPQPGPDRSIATATNSPCDSNPAHSISHIHRFLQNCSPPLDHLLSRFVDLGFHTQDILREVAHTWSIEERRALMTRLAPGPNGKRMTELELAALERGFQAVRSTAHQ